MSLDILSIKAAARVPSYPSRQRALTRFGDQLIIELVESADADAQPPVIGIRWPSKVTVTAPAA